MILGKYLRLHVVDSNTMEIRGNDARGWGKPSFKISSNRPEIIIINSRENPFVLSLSALASLLSPLLR